MSPEMQMQSFSLDHDAAAQSKLNADVHKGRSRPGKGQIDYHQHQKPNNIFKNFSNGVYAGSDDVGYEEAMPKKGECGYALMVS